MIKFLYKQKRVFNFLRQRINGNLLNVFRQVILFPNLKKKIHPCIRVLTFSCCMHPISVICSFSNNQLMVQHFLKAKQMGEYLADFMCQTNKTLNINCFVLQTVLFTIVIRSGFIFFYR